MDAHWLRGLGHILKAGGLALFDGETHEAENDRPVRKRSTSKKPTKNCCLAERPVPRVRDSGSHD